MKIPEYVTKDEVRRVCRELGINDWTQIKEGQITDEEAEIILGLVNSEGMDIPLEEFMQGLEVELEHGTRFADANITNNHPLLTGKIVLAHLKEAMDYYERVLVAELEGDLLKAIRGKNISKVEDKYKKLAAARKMLSQIELAQL